METSKTQNKDQAVKNVEGNSIQDMEEVEENIDKAAIQSMEEQNEAVQQEMYVIKCFFKIII